VKDLLHNIASKFPELISDVLRVLKLNLKNVSNFDFHLFCNFRILADNFEI
jgi:hypothetical protein